MTGSYLVTGGAGFIGSRLCLRLKAWDPEARVVAFDNLHRRGSELQVPRLRSAGVEFVRGDVRCAEELDRLERCDVVVDAAADPSVLAGVDGDPSYVVRSNLVGALNCLEIARRWGAGFVLLSTSRVYPVAALRAIPLLRVGQRFEPEPAAGIPGLTAEGITEAFPLGEGTRTLYGATKYAAELLALEYGELYGFPVVIDRCGVVAGPWQMARVEQGVVGLWCARHVYGGSLAYIGHDGFQVRDALHVDDLVDLLLIQVERLGDVYGEVFNVGGGRGISFSLRELTALCREVSGREIPVGRVDAERPGDVPWYVTDASRVRARLGWSPRRDLRRIVEDTVAWLRGHRAEVEPVLGGGT